MEKENNVYRDPFRIIAPGLTDSDKRGVIRIPPSTYDRLNALSKETGVSICRIVDQCVAFALERLEGDEDVTE
jgi:predicted DNA-binding protein